MSAERWARRAALVVALAGCSTIAAIPDAEECTRDDECAPGLVCAVDQGRCLPGNEAAPRAHLAFDIRERATGQVRFRVEVDGCDCTIDEEENIRELALSRARVSQRFELVVTTPIEMLMDPPDPLAGLLPASFELTQPSRFGHPPSPQLGLVDHPTLTEDGQMAVDTLIRWPRYHPLDQGVPPETVQWKVQPEGELALRYLGIIPPRTDAMSPCTVDADCCSPAGDCDPAPNYCDLEAGQCTAIGQPEWIFSYRYEPDCSRRVRGTVISLDPQFQREDGVMLPDSTVVLRYADGEGPDGRFGIPMLGERPADERPPQCAVDADCADPDRYCDPATRQCFLALAGRTADRGSTTNPATFNTQVYTYCDAQPNAATPRDFEVTVDPPGPRPTVNYRVRARFPPPLNNDPFGLGDFCVPNWGPGVELSLRFEGQPRTLVAGDTEYTCCDVSCLPTSAADVAAGPPSAPVTCDGRTGSPPLVEVQSPFVLEDRAAWDEADCAPPNPDAQGRLGSLSRLAQCPAVGLPCTVEDVALGTASEPRRYEVRIESPEGSVVASGDYTVEVSDEVPATMTLPLQPRVLVTGFVDVDETICARREAGEDCAAREAVVLAERLRMDEPEGSVPGPYFHSVSTFFDPNAQRDGAFVLPLDPGGVYVVTALPSAGAEGGPSGFTVVNLRADAPTELQPLRLVLEDGVVVTLRLDQFDERTVVIPLDRGSYLVEGQTLLHPLRTNTSDPIIDLNRIGECWTPSELGPQGCQIRRLIPSGSDLARSQVGVARFTARRSDQAECTVRCPGADPGPSSGS